MQNIEKIYKINKNLILFNSNCTFKENILGGNPCGDDGEWNTSVCVPSYCDNNYIFDKKNQKCIFDNCTILKINPFSYLFVFIFFISLLIFLGMMIYGCALCCCCSKKKNNMPETNQKLVDDDEEEVI